MVNKIKNNNKGFTILELLVVVAILSILVSLVLVIFSNARNKGADAVIKSSLKTVQNQSELYYLKNGNSYVAPLGPTQTLNVCPSATSQAITYPDGTMFQNEPIIRAAIRDAISKTFTPVGSLCAFNSKSWIVIMRLRSSPAQSANSRYWCVDSGGKSKELVGTLVAVKYRDGLTYRCQ